MENRFSERIISHVASRRYEPRGIEPLAEELGIAESDREDFFQAVKSMIKAGHVVMSSKRAVTLPPPGPEVLGTFRKHPRGFGFITPDSPLEHGDLFVPPGNVGKAMSGDRVRARTVRMQGRQGRSDRSPYVGRIIEIIKRGEHRYTGNLMRRGKAWVVEVDGRGMSEPIIIGDPHAKDAREGDKVVVELIEFGGSREAHEGVIVDVLGRAGEVDVETAAVIRNYHLPGEFPEEIFAEAREVTARFDPDDLQDREDLRQSLIITIDPPDARDFDDAISIRRLNPDTDHAAWELGVHIADVSYFIKAGRALDNEAKERGNSVYLPRKVIPMLPEILSNGVCSLQEGVARYTKTAWIRYDAAGQVVGERFSRSVIHSAKRLTYLEAQALIEGDTKKAREHARTEPNYQDDVISALKQMDELARILRKRRLRDGMIVLNLPEADLVFDEDGRVIDAVPEDDAFTHTIIEMFMVEANEASARLFDRLELPMIRRIHPPPPATDTSELRNFARVAGYNIPAQPSPAELQALLDSVRGKPTQHAVHLAVLQTLSRAEYSPLPVGHFALASEHYSHFTSPIRRYPDLILHRAIDAWFDLCKQEGIDQRERPRKKLNWPALGKKLGEDKRLLDDNALVTLGRHCSATERNAEAAERDLRTYLVLELLAQKTGEEAEGTVTGVTGQGVFIQLDKYLVDGFVEADSIQAIGDGRERFRINPQTGALTGQRSGASIQIGDRMAVRIDRVGPRERLLQLAIIKALREPGGSRTAAKGKKPDKKARQLQAVRKRNRNKNRKR
ncbi:MAG: VacB/RNase II family 3'-5' exoribonuclease [Phycisphaeraceae bacterium]|nr:VacB/RNase II family 3'-5' exoribonuclease [Phycisphaeraceae bacterium]